MANAPIHRARSLHCEGTNVRIHPIVTSGVGLGVAATLTVVTAATALAAPASHTSSRKHPVASLRLSATRPAVGTTITANASHSHLPKGDHLRKAKIVFGDRSKAVVLRSLKTRAHHKYAKAGTYKVVLTIVDKHRVKARKTMTVTVHAVHHPSSPTSPTPPASTGLPVTIPSGLSPTTLISSLGLSSTALSSVSSLLGIPVSTLTSLPVGFLSLLPVGDLTGAALPGLPGLASLPLVGDLVGMLLAGLPISIPSGVDPTTLISALPSGVLSVLQLATLSTFFGIPTSVLETLPVNVLTLLPTGLLSGL